jgi:hypothetical protein
VRKSIGKEYFTLPPLNRLYGVLFATNRTAEHVRTNWRSNQLQHDNDDYFRHIAR